MAMTLAKTKLVADASILTIVRDILARHPDASAFDDRVIIGGHASGVWIEFRDDGTVEVGEPAA
jgi:hypothetical protein